MTVSKPTFSAGPEPVMARAALYMSSTDGDAVTPQTSDLMACARHAEKAGLRIVALAGDYDHGDGLGGDASLVAIRRTQSRQSLFEAGRTIRKLDGDHRCLLVEQSTPGR